MASSVKSILASLRRCGNIAITCSEKTWNSLIKIRDISWPPKSSLHFSFWHVQKIYDEDCRFHGGLSVYCVINSMNLTEKKCQPRYETCPKSRDISWPPKSSLHFSFWHVQEIYDEDCRFHGGLSVYGAINSMNLTEKKCQPRYETCPFFANKRCTLNRYFIPYYPPAFNTQTSDSIAEAAYTKRRTLSNRLLPPCDDVAT